ncbi:MAG: hypothetical protein IJ830_00320 [Alphaproteobacteria bacterium]|nr:hypothetical protein [Alphaproteobacteria bacterium]
MIQKRFLILFLVYFGMIQPLSAGWQCSDEVVTDTSAYIGQRTDIPIYAVTYTDNSFIPTTTKEYNEKDGSYTIKDAEGNIIGYKGKRIYTIEEANLVAKPTGNTIRIKYR